MSAANDGQRRTMNKRVAMIACAALAVGLSPVRAQEPAAPAKDAGEMEAMPGMDHSQMDHSQMDTGVGPGADQDGKSGATQDMGQDISSMNQGGGMDHGSMSMQGGKAPPDARDPHAYADGHDLGPLGLHLAGEHSRGSLLVDNLETVRAPDNTSAEYDLQAWYGRTYDRAVLKAEGEVDAGRLAEARTELLWGHAVAAFWDAQLGARHDGGEGPNRSWLAFGVQGLAPYWFAIDAAVYVGESGRSALRLDVEYELLLTQRLILQPQVETNFYGKADVTRGLGSGLSDVGVALRLRYEIRREFAPYIGVERVFKFGDSADFARAAGADTAETRIVAGVRFWF